MDGDALDRRAESLRAFNRFYTARLQLLDRAYLDSPFSLAEVRVLYELAHRDGLTASMLASELGLDAGYLSRILHRFRQQDLVAATTKGGDGRQRVLALTAHGRAVFAPLKARSQDDIRAVLEPLPDEAQRDLVAAGQTIMTILGGTPAPAPVIIRDWRPGDIGWIVSAHGRLYNAEYGWDSTFEALVAEIAAKFIRDFDPASENCWIAEQDGRNLGSVVVVRKSADTAQLRLLILDPAARGQRLGARLVDTAMAFARARGYARMMLWTNDCLHAARRIYVNAGFRLVEEEAHHSFGVDLVGQNWERDL